LHEPALDKLAGTHIGSLVKSFRALAALAAESNAATADFTLSWLDDQETVKSRYVPELICRVKKVT